MNKHRFVDRTWKLEVGGHRNIGKPKLRYYYVIRKYMKEKQLKIEEAQDWRAWIMNTRCANPK